MTNELRISCSQKEKKDRLNKKESSKFQLRPVRGHPYILHIDPLTTNVGIRDVLHPQPVPRCRLSASAWSPAWSLLPSPPPLRRDTCTSTVGTRTKKRNHELAAEADKYFRCEK